MAPSPSSDTWTSARAGEFQSQNLQVTGLWHSRELAGVRSTGIQELRSRPRGVSSSLQQTPGRRESPRSTPRWSLAGADAAANDHPNIAAGPGGRSYHTGLT